MPRSQQGEADLVQALTYPLPATVIAEIIGIPAEDRSRFKRWSDEAIASLGPFFGGIDQERLQRQGRLLDEMRAYFVPLAEERARRPGRIARACAGGARGLASSRHEEMLQMLILLLVAGNGADDADPERPPRAARARTSP